MDLIKRRTVWIGNIFGIKIIQIRGLKFIVRKNVITKHKFSITLIRLIVKRLSNIPYD